MRRTHPVLELYSSNNASVASMQTSILRDSYEDLAASGVLGLLNTFCLHNGTNLEVGKNYM